MKRKLARRAVAFLTALVLGVSSVPVNALAKEAFAVGECVHHRHSEECGYIVEMEDSCTYDCTECFRDPKEQAEPETTEQSESEIPEQPEIPVQPLNLEEECLLDTVWNANEKLLNGAKSGTEYSIEFDAALSQKWNRYGNPLITGYTILKNGEEMSPSLNFGVACEVTSSDGGRWEIIDENSDGWHRLHMAKALDAGTYTVTAKLYRGTPDQVVASSTKTITVTKYVAIVNIVPKTEVVYTGEIFDAEDLIESVAFTNLGDYKPDYDILVTPYNTSNPNCEVGSCSFKCEFSFKENDARNITPNVGVNNNWNESMIIKSFNVTILRATPTLEVVTKEFSYKNDASILSAAEIIEKVRIIGVKGETLAELSAEDYDAQLEEPSNGGERYRVQVTLNNEWISTDKNYGNLTEGASATKEISPFTLTPVFEGGKSSDYDGASLEVNSSLIDSVYVMVDGEKMIIDSSKYEVSVEPNAVLCDAGEYTLIVTVPNEITYEGNAGLYVVPAGTTGTVTYTINKIDGKIESFQIEDWIYGNPAGAITLTSPNDVSSASYFYESTDGNNYSSSEMPTNAGSYKATVTIPASKNYKEVTADYTFQIEKRTLTAADLTFTPPVDLEYGGEKTAAIEVQEGRSGVGAITVNYYDSEGELLSGSPSAHGRYYVKIDAAEGSNYKAIQDLSDESWSFTIVQRDVEDLDIHLGSGIYTYTGEQMCPEVTVKHGNSMLIEGKDYILKYGENVDAGNGSGSVTVQMQGNYTGETTKTFTITPKDLNVTITGMDKQYDGTSRVEYTAALLGLVQKDQETVVLDKSQEVKAVYMDADDQEVYQTGNGYRVVFDSDFSIVCTDTQYGHENGLCPCKNYNLIQPIGITGSIVNTWTPKLGAEYAINNAVSAEGWMNQNLVITANGGSDDTVADGFLISLTNTAGEENWKESLTFENTGENLEVTIYVKNRKNGDISLPVTVVYSLDKSAPTGMISLEGTGFSWQEAVYNADFNMFYNTAKQVTIKAQDQESLSGIRSVEYYVSPEVLSENELMSRTEWTPYTDDNVVEVALEDGKQFIVYARITDKADNVVYLSTDGVVYDKTAPKITNLEADAVYYTTRTVELSDLYLAEGKLNEVLGQANETGKMIFTLEGNKEQTYKIFAADKAGNQTEISVKMLPISVLEEPIAELTVENVTANDQETILAVLEKTKAVDYAEATSSEKDALNAVIEKCEALLLVIADTKKEVEDITGVVSGLEPDKVTSEDENIVRDVIMNLEELLSDPNITEEQKLVLEEQKTEAKERLEEIQNNKQILEDALKAESDTTAENYDTEDKDALEAAVLRLEKLLESDNYTEGEKKQIKAEAERMEKIIESIERVYTVKNQIEKAAENIAVLEDVTEIPGEEALVEQIVEAMKSYDKLSEKEKSLIDDGMVEKMKAAMEKAVSFRITEGDGNTFTKGNDEGLTFKANGAVKLYKETCVDGVTVLLDDITVTEGSTIVTLHKEYLETLSEGAHKFEIIYEVNGDEYTAFCVFHVKLQETESEQEPSTDGETESEQKPSTGEETEPKEESPATGNPMNPGLWIAVMGMSAFSMIRLLTVILKKRMTR